MTHTPLSKEIAGGYALAGFTLCLGVYLGVKCGSPEGSMLTRGFAFLALGIVAKYTFAWGGRRGFPAWDHEGHINGGNVLRNLVMTAIVWVLFALFVGPFVLAALRLAQ